jgi:beta-lactamase regulating signal transducer with metallopeptidase domain
MSPSDAVVTWLLTYLLHSTVLLIGGWSLNRWRVRNPAIREVVWKLALIAGVVTASLQTAGLAPVTAQYSVPGAAAAVPNAPAGPADPTDVVSNRSAEPTEAAATDLGAASTSASTRPVSSLALPSISDLALGIWLAVAALLVLGFAWRRWQLANRLGARRPLTGHPIVAELELLRTEAGHRRRVVLTVSDRLSSPIAVGVSEICVPAIALRELDRRERRSMLAHELAHLIRLDTVWLTVAALLERLFFFQPLNRVARRAIQADAELLCDEWAATRLGSGLTMAKCLVKVAEWIDAAPRPIPVAGMAEERSQLINRVQRLVEEGEVSFKPNKRLVLGGAVALMAGTALIAPSVSLGGEDPASRPTGSEVKSGSSGRDEEPTHLSTGSLVSPAELDQEAPKLDTWELVAPGRDHQGGPSYQDTSSAVVSALIATLEDGNAAVRRAAAQSLGNIRNRRATPALIAAIDDEDEDVRAAVVEALGELRDPKAIDALSGRLRDAHRDVRRTALNALSNFEQEDLSPALFRPALDDEDPDTRATAARMLGDFRDEESVAALIRLLGDPNADVRQSAAQALGNIKSRSALDPLSERLKDPNTDVRQAVLQALGEFELESAPAGVLEALTDRSADIRQAAAHLVGHIGDRRSVPSLRNLINDPNPEVRQAAVEALSEIRDQASIDALVVGLKSSDPVVRKAAAEALGQKHD